MSDRRAVRRLQRHGLHFLLDAPVTWFADTGGVRHLHPDCADTRVTPVRLPFPHRPAARACPACCRLRYLPPSAQAARLVGEFLTDGAPVRLRANSWPVLRRAVQHRRRVIAAAEHLLTAPSLLGPGDDVAGAGQVRAEMEQALDALWQQHRALSAYVASSAGTVVTYAAAQVATTELARSEHFPELLRLSCDPAVDTTADLDLLRGVVVACPALLRWRRSAEEGDPVVVRRRHWGACVAASGSAGTARSRAVASLGLLERLEHRFTRLRVQQPGTLVVLHLGGQRACLPQVVAEVFGAARHEHRVLALVPPVLATVLCDRGDGRTESVRLPDHPDAVQIARTVWADADGQITGSALADVAAALLR